MAVEKINGLSPDVNGNVTLTATDIDGSVKSVAGKTGVVTLTVNDVDGAAPLINPSFTGEVTAPTVSSSDSSSHVATTQFVHDVVGEASGSPVDSVNGKIGAVVLGVGDIDGAAPLNSPVLSGNPTAPTQPSTDSSNRVATTAHVKSAIYSKADLVSPVFGGQPTVPTAAPGTNNAQIASTSFVQAAISAIANGSGSAPIIKKPTEDTSRVSVSFNQSAGDGWGVAHIQLAVAMVSANGVTVGGVAKEYLLKVKNDSTTEVISTIRDNSPLSGVFTIDNYANRTDFTYKSNVVGGTHLWSIKVAGIGNVQLTSSTPTSTTPTPPPSSDPRPQLSDTSMYGPHNFSDDFSTTTLNSTFWNKKQYNGTDDPTQNFSLVGGNLNLWPQQDGNSNWVTRYIDTDGKFYLTYGYTEIEAKLSRGKGVRNSIYLKNHDLAGTYFIALLEAYPGGGVDSWWSDVDLNAINYIGGYVNPSEADDDSHWHSLRNYYDGYNLSNSFHKYGVHWDSSGIQLYFDGQPLGPKIDSSNLTSRAYISIELEYGSASGDPDGTTPQGVGNALQINYVRTWPLATVQNPAPSPSPVTKKVAYWGDSTIWGWDGASGGAGTRVANPAPAVFGTSLPANPPYTVINEGVNGCTMKMTLNGTDGVHSVSWSNYVANTDVDIVIINNCINDTYESGTTTSTYKDTLRQIIDLAQARGIVVILETPNVTDDSQVDAFRQAMLDVATERGILVIDQYTYISDYMSSHSLGVYDIMPDGTHPNQATYTLKGQYAAQRFGQIMTQVSPPPTASNGYIAPKGQSANVYPVMCFNEEFDGTSLNSSLWNTQMWWEAQNDRANYSVKNGLLNLWPMDPFTKTNRTVDTDGKYEQKFGYFESEIKMPYGIGQWPAFWLYGHRDSAGNEFGGRPELDVMEAYTGGGYDSGWSGTGSQENHPVNYAGTVHAQNEANIGSYNLAAEWYKDNPDARPDLSAAFHVYGAHWDAGGVQFYFDGQPMGQKIDSSSELTVPMYLILDLWLGTSDAPWAGIPDNTTPQSEARAMQVKYVRAWKLNDGSTSIRGSYNMPQITYDPNATAAPAPAPSPAPATDPLPLGISSSLVGDMSFRQDFDSTSLDSSYWYPSMPGETAGQSTTPYENPNLSLQNYEVSGGSLKIWPDTDGTGNFYRKTISTEGKFFQKYGIFEMRAKLPRGKGCFPRFFMLSTENNSPDLRPEIDIMHAFSGASSAGYASADLQSNDYLAQSIQTNASVLGSRKMGDFFTQTNLSDSFHKYTVLWDATGISFYFDGHKLGSTLTGHDDTYRMFLAVALWFGSLSGAPDVNYTTRGAANSFEIDYVYAWKLADGSSVISGTAPIYSPNTPPPPPGKKVKTEFWGMHTSASTLEPWPSVSFATQRLWDSYPGISWADINTADGVYDWTNLDAHLAVSASHSITELIYTFGYVPTWVTGSQTDNPTDAAWSAFVTAVVNRYSATIKYFQIWNEPNSTTFWTGTAAQMAHLASIAAPIIRGAGCKVLGPCPQGANAHTWMQDFLAAGGGAYIDIVAFNSYTYNAPETLVTNYSNLSTVLANNSQTGKEVWDTEHSWGSNSDPFGASDTLKRAYLARLIALSVTLGISRSIWYSYDNATYGTLADKTTDTLLPPGVAYNTLYTWINGKYLDTPVVGGDVYTINVADSTGYSGKLVWNVTGNSSYTVPTGIYRYIDLDGTATATTPGTSVTIGIEPKLFDNFGAPAQTSSPDVMPTGQGTDFSLTFYDEFSASGSPDTTKWVDVFSYQTSNPTVNYDVSNGKLRIWPALDGSSNFFDRTICSNGKFAQTYGFFESDIQMPVGAGLRLVYGLFDHANNRQIGIEAYSGAPAGDWSNDSLQAIDMAIQVYDGNTDTLLNSFRISSYGGVPNLSTGSHKIGIWWDTDVVKFFLDGEQIGPTIDSPPWVSDMYMYHGVWMSDNETTPSTGVGTPSSTNAYTPIGSNNSMLVNYARAWQFGATGGGMVLDQIGTSSTAAYSTRKLRGAYTGPAMRVRRSIDNVEFDVGFTTNGELDVGLLTSQSQPGDNNDLFITKWYDQSGNGRHLLQATALAQPPIVWSNAVQYLNSKPAPRFVNANGFYLQAAGFTAPQPWTRSSVVEFLDVANGTNRVLIDNQDTSIAGSLYTPNTSNIYMYRGQNMSIYGSLAEDLKATIVERSNGATSKGVINGSATVGDPGTNGYSGLTVGCKRDISLYASGRIGEVILFAAALSDSEITVLTQNQKTFWGTP